MSEESVSDLFRDVSKKRVLFSVAICIVLLTVAASFVLSPVVANTDWQSQFEGQIEGEPPIQGASGVSVQEYYTLWQNTPAGVINHYDALLDEYVNAEWDGASNVEPSSDFPTTIYQKTLLVVSAGYLQTFADYPSEIQNWNDANINTFSPGGKDKSRRPTGGSTDRGDYVDDAYVDITSMPGSAVHHTYSESGNAMKTQLVNPDTDTSVNIAGDYKTDIDEDVNSDTVRVDYDLKNHRISETRILVDGEEVSSSESESHTESFEISSSDIPSDVSTVTVEMDITAVVNVHRERLEVYCADSFNGTCNRYSERFVTVKDGPTYRTLTVTDTRSVTPTSLDSSDIEVEYLNHPDGYTIARVNTDGGWISFDLPGDVSVFGPYRGYSSRNTEWDTVSTDDTQNISSVHPSVFHIRPSKNGITVPPSQAEYGIDFTQTTGGVVQYQGSVPNSLKDTQVDLQTSEYNSTREFEFQSQDVVFEGSDDSVVFHGYTGEDVSVPAESAGEIRRTNISVTNISRVEDRETVDIEIKLTDSGGNPVRTDDRTGSVNIAGSQVNTGPNGIATTTLSDSTDVFVVTYNPAERWKYDTIYIGSKVNGEVPTEPISLIQYLNGLIPAVTLLSFMYIILKIVYKGTTGR